MASYSCTVLYLVLVLVLVLIGACGWLEKVASISGAAEHGGSDDHHDSGYHKAGGATWTQSNGYAGGSGGATWGQEIGCSPCAEVYVVRDEGETLQTISEKCHAPFILLDNPHVQDTDDISAGSVLLITSTHLPC